MLNNTITLYRRYNGETSFFNNDLRKSCPFYWLLLNNDVHQ